MSMQIRSFFVYAVVFVSFTGLSSTLIANDFSALFDQPISDNTVKAKPINPEKQKAFFEALIKGNLSMVKSLIDSVDVNAPEASGLTPLIYASYQGYTDIVKELINAGADVNYVTQKGAFALFVAAFNGHRDVTKLLLEAKADLNLKNSKGTTALMLLAHKNDVELVKLFLQHGADASLKDINGSTALDAAKINNSKQVVALLDSCLPAPIPVPPEPVVQVTEPTMNILQAAHEGNVPEVKANIITNKKSVLLTNADGNTALMLAADGNHEILVPILVQAGANLNAKNNNGVTALMLAAYKGNEQALSALITAGANLEVRNSGNGTALTIAVLTSQEKCVEALIKAGADVNVEDDFGTPLLHAEMTVVKKSPIIIQMLKNAGAKHK